MDMVTFSGIQPHVVSKLKSMSGKGLIVTTPFAKLLKQLFSTYWAWYVVDASGATVIVLVISLVGVHKNEPPGKFGTAVKVPVSP
jgi:hypothetical protein